MGIFIGEKLLEPKENGTSIEKKYFREREELKEFFNKFKVRGVEKPVIILTRDYPKRYNRAKTSWKPAAPMALPMTTTVHDETLGSLEVRYSSLYPRKSNNKLLWPRNKNVEMFFDTMALSSQELDLAWYLLVATDFLSRGMFKVVDTRSEYKTKFEEVVLQKEVMNLLMADYATEEQLAKVAHDFFDDGEIDYNSISSKEEMAIKIWTKALVEDKKTRKNKLEEVLRICKKYKLHKAPEPPAAQVIVVEDEEGNKKEIPLLDAPKNLNRQEYFALAEELKIKNLAKNARNPVLYTLVEYHKELVNT